MTKLYGLDDDELNGLDDKLVGLDTKLNGLDDNLLGLDTKLNGLTLSLLGYLKTRICWGGGQFDPPPLNPMFYVQIWQMINH